MRDGPADPKLLCGWRPGSYWCNECRSWPMDCEHLVESLDCKRVPVTDSVYTYIAYDRTRRILELGMHAGGTYQIRDVPLSLAVGMWRAPSPCNFEQQFIGRRFPFDRVRVRRTTETPPDGSAAPTAP